MVKMLFFDLKETEKKYFEFNNVSDFEITYFEESLCEETKLTLKEYENTVVLSVFISSKITANVLDQFKNLQIIATRSIEYNHIDIDECRRRNIAVIHVNDYGSTAVAQYVFAVIFALCRKIIPAARDIKNKNVSYEKYEGTDISALSIGIIGTGSVGTKVCKIANSLGMKIFANDIRVNPSINDFVEYVSFSDLLRMSDIITLHIPFVKDFHHMISSQELEIMKENAILINTSSGELVDSIALFEAIKNEKLGGAALDVTECNEWRNNTQIFSNKDKKLSYECLENIIVTGELMKYDNVIITPRIAYNTVNSAEKILNISFNDIKNYFKGGYSNRIV